MDEPLSHRAVAVQKWRAEIAALKAIARDCGLTEERKWYQPCYTSRGKNIVLVGAFKKYCALLFFKGALLKDHAHLLVAPGENSQSGRLIRFTSVQDIAKRASALKAYIRDAVRVEEAGLKVPKKEITEHKVPAELKTAFADHPGFQKAFRALTPGRQRAYLLHFSGAKQSQTRAARIDKWRPHILKGKGIQDEG